MYKIRVLSGGKWHTGEDQLPEVPRGSTSLVELKFGEYTNVQVSEYSAGVWSSYGPIVGPDIITLGWDKIELLQSVRKKYYGD